MLQTSYAGSSVHLILKAEEPDIMPHKIITIDIF